MSLNGCYIFTPSTWQMSARLSDCILNSEHGYRYGCCSKCNIINKAMPPSSLSISFSETQPLGVTRVPVDTMLDVFLLPFWTLFLLTWVNSLAVAKPTGASPNAIVARAGGDDSDAAGIQAKSVLRPAIVLHVTLLTIWPLSAPQRSHGSLQEAKRSSSSPTKASMTLPAPTFTPP